MLRVAEGLGPVAEGLRPSGWEAVVTGENRQLWGTTEGFATGTT